MCMLALTAVGAVAVDQFQVEPEPLVLVMPGGNPQEMPEAAWAIEQAIEHAFDDISPEMSGDGILMAVIQALRPSDNSPSAYDIIICQVGVKEEGGNLVVSLRVEYEFRDGELTIGRKLFRNAVLQRGGFSDG